MDGSRAGWAIVHRAPSEVKTIMVRDDLPQRRQALLHPGLVTLGASLLIAVLATDVLYWKTLLFQWNNFSAWLLLAGLVVTALAAIAFVIDLLRRRLRGVAWLRLIALTAAALLSLLNIFVHSRDAYTAVVPEGIILSLIVAALLVAVGFSGYSLAASRPAPDTLG